MVFSRHWGPERGAGRGRVHPYSPRNPSKAPHISEPCMIYTRSGRCDQRPGCRYQHEPGRTAICPQYIKTGRCTKQGSERCTLSHTPRAENAPMCVHYARGNCTKTDCQFTHMTQLGAAPETKPTCRTFAVNGWCDRGSDCTKRHTFECPDFEIYGKCPNQNCKLQHVIKADILARAEKIQAADAKTPAGSLTGRSEKIDVANFLIFLKTATRESCNHKYLRTPSNEDDESEKSDSASPSESESDIDWANEEVEPGAEPLDTSADFISL